MQKLTLVCLSCADDFEHTGTHRKRFCPDCFIKSRRKAWRESAERKRRAAGMLDMYGHKKKIVEKKPRKPPSRKLIPYAGRDRSERSWW